jgi:hypothetical protein
MQMRKRDIAINIGAVLLIAALIEFSVPRMNLALAAPIGIAIILGIAAWYARIRVGGMFMSNYFQYSARDLKVRFGVALD